MDTGSCGMTLGVWGALGVWGVLKVLVGCIDWKAKLAMDLVILATGGAGGALGPGVNAGESLTDGCFSGCGGS